MRESENRLDQPPAAWQYDRTGRLRAPWISHMIVDAGIFGLGYFLIRDML